MTRLTLTKHHGLGNDFLVLWDAPEVELADLARRVCDRRRGLGADGLLVGGEVSGHDAVMRLFNADGSVAEMSGNGIRCFAQALARRERRGGRLSILTDAGVRVVDLSPTADPSVVQVTVDMGPVGELPEPGGWSELGCDPMRPVRHLSVGNPHSVVGVEDVASVDLAMLGGVVPQVNLEIVEPGPESGAITMRVHERGAGITEACGTGACASARAAVDWGLVTPVDGRVVVHMDGGDAVVILDRPEPGRVTLVGPAQLVGELEVELA